MPDRLTLALSRTSVRIALALVLLGGSAWAGVWAADSSGTTDSDFNLNGAGGKNVVQIYNQKDQRLVVKGGLQLNKIPAPKVAPINIASATASCVGCQTYAVALQINVYERGAPQVTPGNAAAAVNAHCRDCITVAQAIQYTIPVDDINSVPKEVKSLAHELQADLRSVEGVYDTSSFSIYQANERISATIAEFDALGQYLLYQSRQETAEDTPAPEASPSPSPEPSPETAESPSPDGSAASPSPDTAPSSESAPSSPPADTESPSPDATASPCPSGEPAPSPTDPAAESPGPGGECGLATDTAPPSDTPPPTP